MTANLQQIKVLIAERLLSANESIMSKNPPSEASGQTPAARRRPFIIPIFLPHAGCPHQCVFCNQSSITGAHSTPASIDVHHQIETFLNYRRKECGHTQIAFFGGNFFGIQPQAVKRLLAEATEAVNAGQADSIRFSTRPDTIDRQQLAGIKAFPVTTIELGVQSMNNTVLKRSNRGHTAADTVTAVQLLKEHDYEVGVQMMVGLPGDNAQRLRATARQVARLKPDFIRIYPTVVLAGSPLAIGYQKGDYIPLSLEEAVRQVKQLYLYFKSKNIAVIRMGLQASTDLENGVTILAGPYHPAFGHLVYSEIFLDMAIAQLESLNATGEGVRVHVHSRSISKMRGPKNGNIKKLSEKFHLQTIEIIPDNCLKEDQLTVTIRS